jgi:hypothetical protein
VTFLAKETGTLETWPAMDFEVGSKGAEKRQRAAKARNYSRMPVTQTW